MEKIDLFILKNMNRILFFIFFGLGIGFNNYNF